MNSKKMDSASVWRSLFHPNRIMQPWWSGKGREGWAAFLPHPQGSGDCPVPLPKTVRRAKGFKKLIQPMRLRDKRVPFLAAPPLQV